MHAKCRDAQVSEVPTHGLRGSLATLLDQVALRLSDTSRALGHADSKVTEESYIRQDGRTVVRLRDIEARRPTAKDAER
ncbi:MAG: hypothetical protein M5U09_13630 [Gammaproteobacteria bacterium]|nr:hypothetical protein [Gammaproteobacteria bacterium]